jgi:hypothetical protein
MRIDRCICFDRSFEELKRAADAEGIASLDVLQERVEFGLQCELCHPYVRRMLRTGETWFGRIITEDDEPAQS